MARVSARAAGERCRSRPSIWTADDLEQLGQDEMRCASAHRGVPHRRIILWCCDDWYDTLDVSDDTRATGPQAHGRHGEVRKRKPPQGRKGKGATRAARPPASRRGCARSRATAAVASPTTEGEGRTWRTTTASAAWATSAPCEPERSRTLPSRSVSVRQRNSSGLALSMLGTYVDPLIDDAAESTSRTAWRFSSASSAPRTAPVQPAGGVRAAGGMAGTGLAKMVRQLAALTELRPRHPAWAARRLSSARLANPAVYGRLLQAPWYAGIARQYNAALVPASGSRS